MKVVAINGSARKDGNTAILIRRVLQVFESEGIETELIQLAGNKSMVAWHAELAEKSRTNNAKS